MKASTKRKIRRPPSSSHRLRVDPWGDEDTIVRRGSWYWQVLEHLGLGLPEECEVPDNFFHGEAVVRGMPARIVVRRRVRAKTSPPALSQNLVACEALSFALGNGFWPCGSHAMDALDWLALAAVSARVIGDRSEHVQQWFAVEDRMDSRIRSFRLPLQGRLDLYAESVARWRILRGYWATPPTSPSVVADVVVNICAPTTTMPLGTVERICGILREGQPAQLFRDTEQVVIRLHNQYPLAF